MGKRPVIIARLCSIYSTSSAVLEPIAAVPSAATIYFKVRVAGKGDGVRDDLRARSRAIAAAKAQVGLWQINGTIKILRAAARQVKSGARRHIAVAINSDALGRSGSLAPSKLRWHCCQSRPCPTRCPSR